LENFELTYKPFGAHAILVEWPQKINEKTVVDVLRFKKIIKNNYIKQKVEINSAYCSILINYHRDIDKIYDEILHLKSLYWLKNEVQITSYNLYKIPVCYDAFFGLDLELISEKKELPIKEIINCHSTPIYIIYFIGFLPGFLYLGGLDNNLHMPRLDKPRMKVLKGAVGIGGEQTGIYPNESPGGWNILGNSPIDFFDVSQSEPCFAQAGDKIQFCPISMDEYKLIKDQLKAGTYQIESEVLND